MNNPGYTRRQEFVCTLDELNTYASAVLYEHEVLYVKQANGSYDLKIGDGITPVGELPYVIRYADIKASAEGAEQARIVALAAQASAVSAEQFARNAMAKIGSAETLSDRITQNDKRLTNLEAGVPASNFVTVNPLTVGGTLDAVGRISVSQSDKTDMAPYAELMLIGGYSYKPPRYVWTPLYSGGVGYVSVSTEKLPLRITVEVRSSTETSLQLNLNASQWVFEFEVPGDNEWHEYATMIDSSNNMWGDEGWMKGEPFQGNVDFFDSSYSPVGDYAEARNLTISAGDAFVGDTIISAKLTKLAYTETLYEVPEAIVNHPLYGLSVYRRYANSDTDGVLVQNILDLTNGRLIERVHRVVFDHNSAWRVWQATGYTEFRVDLPEGKPGPYYEIGCLASLPGTCVTDLNTANSFDYTLGAETFTFRCDEFSTLSQLQEYLREHPIELLYPYDSASTGEIRHDVSELLGDRFFKHGAPTSFYAHYSDLQAKSGSLRIKYQKKGT